MTDYDTWRERWERVHLAERLADRPAMKVSRARVRRTVIDLRAIYKASGDRRLEAMANVVYGFAPRTNRDYTKAAKLVYMARMRQILRNNSRTVHNAAAQVAVEFAVPGQSFDAAVKKLERAWQREPAPDAEPIICDEDMAVLMRCFGRDSST